MDSIDNIKKEVINNDLSYLELLELYIKYIKLVKELQSPIPSIRSDYKYYMNDKIVNCYGYALRLDLPEYFAKSFDRELGDDFDFYPGCFSGIHDILTEEDLLKGLYGDLDVLGIKYNECIDSSHLYKIALYYQKSILIDDGLRDFHFWRLNNNGIWSCKEGYSGRVIKNIKPTCNMGYSLIKKLDIGR